MADFNYSGDSVAATFVAGVFNDAWAAAEKQMASRMEVGEKIQQEVTKEKAYIRIKMSDRNTPAKTGADPWLRTVQVEREYTPNMDKAPEADLIDAEADLLRQHLQDQLTGMLHTFMLDFYPFYQIPDGSDAWERVSETFDNQKLESGIGLVQQRVLGAWSERGITIPGIALDAQQRSVGKAATDAEAQSVRAQELIRLRELKGMDLIRFEQVNRQQIEALEAARAFLLSTLLPMSRKVSEDQERLTSQKRSYMDAYYRYMDTLLAADEAELARLVHERTREMNLQVGKDNRKMLMFQLVAGALENEMSTLAQRASAAIARFGGGSSVSGNENMGV